MKSKICKNCKIEFKKTDAESNSYFINDKKYCSKKCSSSMDREPYINLKYGANMSHQEVAEELGCSRQNIIKIERNAFRKLRANPLYAGLLSAL